jgi:hypothetical protein
MFTCVSSPAETPKGNPEPLSRERPTAPPQQKRRSLAPSDSGCGGIRHLFRCIYRGTCPLREARSIVHFQHQVELCAIPAFGALSSTWVHPRWYPHTRCPPLSRHQAPNPNPTLIPGLIIRVL